MTKAEVLRMAKRRWPKAYIEENRRAPSREERERNLARRRELVARRNEINEELKGPDWVAPLLKAARFVVDVNGDPTAVDQLRHTLEAAERVQALIEERTNNKAEQDRIACWSYRWRIIVDSGMFRHIQVEADTLDELAEKCEPTETVAA